ncbi:Transposon Tf2-2 polyprotein [Vitis vinifera]|uniref:Transposon Tf2-2 polyprotein n=1 Tax=Vitis vinifera TaxID=29760 RepID=A0A438FV21_VITVI|nr:Transposon Tf2-2 polyprotein [Vitis vinifera]
MELGMIDKLHHLEEALNRLSNVLLANPESSNQGNSHRENQNGGRQIVSSKSAKLEFPRFSGDDPTEWFNRVEQFFDYQSTTENQKVPMAAYHLEGEANQWWQWLHRTLKEEGHVISWEKFEEELWARFGPSGCEDFDEALSRIKQLGTLRDYQREFEKLGNRVQGWTQKALVGTFMGGLKAEIADEIRMFKPQSLKEVINLARMRDDQIARQRRFMRLPPVRTPIALPQATRVDPAIPAKPIKRLSWEEMQRKRAQDDQGGEAIEVQEHEPKLEITLHALTGWTVPKTMRVTAKMGPHEVMVLIDSGSTHNFISNRLANKLRLPVIPTETFPVRVANGERLKCQGRYDKVWVELQGTKFYLTLFSLPLSGLDLVLSVQWLEMLGSVVCNWKQLTMDFIWENQDRRLQGVDVQTIQVASSEEILKEFRQRHALFAVCFQPTMETAPADAPTKVTQQSMQRLLKEYEDVFQEPSSLPPAREVDHCITLKEGTEPINIRPYSWRFCTDYRTLNIATIKDCFPIPTVDDMLEELYGATYFTKFDLRAGYHQTNIGDLATTPIFCQGKQMRVGQQELEYLGHIVTQQGVKVDNSKIAAMVAWPHPTNISELRGFLGLTGYYRKFVQNYGIIARPLTNLLKKGKFAWNDEAEAAFLALKQAMTTTPTLAMPNFNDSFTIETDASGEGIGAILSQQRRPIAFMSRALGVTKKYWSTYAKEMLAIVEAIRLWRPYLLGKKFFILTDQRRENSAADALSRKSGSPALLHLHVPVVTVWDEIKKAYEGDSYVQSLTRMANAQLEGSYAWRNGLLFFKGRVVIPSHAALRMKLIHEMHDTKIGGHFGVLRTFKKLAQQFYWPKMYQAVQEYIKKCETCQKVKSETMPPAGLLQPLPIPCQVWDDITLDFIEGLPTSHGKDTILVVVNRLSKSAHFLALTHPFTAKIVAERFVEGVIKLHGLPKSIISDRNPIFISKFWQEFFQMSGTKLQLSSAYHPQTDGQTEVVNRCVEQYLRSMVHQWPRKWSNYLPWAELWYNTTYHASTGMTPFQALYGRLPPQIPIYHNGMSPVHEVDQSLEARDELLRQLKINLETSINRMKQIVDQKRRDVFFEVGDLVFHKLHPYRQQTAFKRAHQKLASRFYGPYPVIQKIGAVAYKLQLPEGARIHPIFHVSLLKNFVGELAEPSQELPPVNEEGVVILEPQHILDTRWVQRGNKFEEENLIQWKHLPVEDATWETNQSLLERFPPMDLGDKCPLNGGGGGGVLIGHDNLRGAINQIPNVWDEWEREEPLDLDWVVAVESPTCRRKWVIRSESFPSFYFRLLCSFVRGFAYLKQPMISLKGVFFFAIKLWFVSHPKRKQSILALYSEFGTYQIEPFYTLKNL